MAWVVDTSVLIDVLENDPVFGAPSAHALDQLSAEGLTVCPVTVVEMAPAFVGEAGLLEQFLRGIGVDFGVPWSRDDTQAGFVAWHRHVTRRRRGEGVRRPIADILIGAFASRFQGLVTRNPDDFRTAFPGLVLRDPSDLVE